jgi:hypothetical protein
MLKAHTSDLGLLHGDTGMSCSKVKIVVEEKVHSSPHKRVPLTSALRLADARHFRVELRNFHHITS